MFTAILAAMAGATGGAAQQLVVRGGVVVSSALARDAIASGASPVSVRARPAPLLGASLLLALQPGVDLELGAGAAFSRLRAEDAGGSRDLQALTVGEALVGVRYGAAERRYLRGGIGVVRYFSAGRGIFASGNGLHPALEAGAGWTRALGVWRVGGELTGQLHPFDTPALRAAGGSGGAVRRLRLAVLLARAGWR